MHIRPLHAMRAIALLLGMSLLSGLATAQSQDPQNIRPQVFAPIVLGATGTASTPTPSPTPLPQPNPPAGGVPTDWLGRVNYYRALVGSPPVTEDAVLNSNCREHARYMAENDDLTHEQDPSLPFASLAGQACAENGNAWLGSAFGTPIWAHADAVDGWVGSVGHRLWMLYPTTRSMGFGFFSAANHRAGAGLDVLSRANFAADTSYTGWPVRYPAPSQSSVPAEQLAITLNWRYFGPSPSVTSTSLRTEAGANIAHTATTDLDAGHKGVQLLPNGALPNNTVIVVEIAGNYNGAPFTSTWRFATGSARVAAANEEPAAMVHQAPMGVEVP
jgi:uncharacterized protein YkwD